MWLKFTGRDRGSFSGGLLPILPVCYRDRNERVSAVRTIRDYGKCLPLLPALVAIEINRRNRVSQQPGFFRGKVFAAVISTRKLSCAPE